MACVVFWICGDGEGREASWSGADCGFLFGWGWCWGWDGFLLGLDAYGTDQAGEEVGTWAWHCCGGGERIIAGRLMPGKTDLMVGETTPDDMDFRVVAVNQERS